VVVGIGSGDRGVVWCVIDRGSDCISGLFFVSVDKIFNI